MHWFLALAMPLFYGEKKYSPVLFGREYLMRVTTFFLQCQNICFDDRFINKLPEHGERMHEMCSGFEKQGSGARQGGIFLCENICLTLKALENCGWYPVTAFTVSFHRDK